MNNAHDATPARCCSAAVPPLPGGVQWRLAPAARRTRRGLLCWVARHPVGGRRLGALIMPPCAFWLARWLAKPQGVAEEQNRFADADSRTRCCGASTKEPKR